LLAISSFLKIDKDFKKNRRILESLFKSFEKYSEESFSYLQEHPAVTTFRSSIIFQLEVNKYQRDKNDVFNDENLSKIIESFQEGFDTLFDQQIENDADIQRPRRKDSVLPIVAKYDFSLLLL
jgi:hypothetical protein